MRRTAWLRAATLVSVAALVGATATQAADPPKQDATPRQWESHLQQRLGLTDQQVQALQQIHQRDAEVWRQHRQALRQARAELRRLILGEADEPSIDAKQAEVQRLMATEVEMRARHLREITPLLTPEQREKFAELGEKRWHRRPYRQHTT